MGIYLVTSNLIAFSPFTLAWINNCIGRRNYRHFFFFLIFLSVHMVTVFVWCTLYVLSNKERLYEIESVVALALMTLIVLLTIPIIGLTIFHIFIVSRGRTTNEQVCRILDIQVGLFNLTIFFSHFSNADYWQIPKWL